jgi:hypothetical protein
VSRKERAGWLLLLFALVWYGVVVMAPDPYNTIQAALHPHPDAPEYLDSAVNLVEGRGFGIHIAGDVHPTRYPPGFPVLLAGLLAAGADPIKAPFLLNRWAGLALLLSLFWVVRTRRGILAAGIAATLLATRASVVVLARAPMSEIVTVLLSFWGAVLVYDYGRGRDRRFGAAGVTLLAAAGLLRFSAVPLLALAGVAWWVRHRARPTAGLNHLVSGGVLATVTLTPLFVYNKLVFESPWRTGYDYWLTENFGICLECVPDNLSVFLLELLQASPASTASLYGEGSFYAPAYFLLVVFCLPRLLASTVMRGFVLVAGLYAFFSLAHPHAVPRLLFPVVTLSIAPVAVVTTAWLTDLYRRRRYVPFAALVLLSLTVIAGWPGTRSHADLGDLAVTHAMRQRALERILVERLEANRGGDAVLVLTDTNPPFLHASLEGDRQIAPLFNEHDYRWNPSVFVFGDTEREAIMAAAVADGRRIYALTAMTPIRALEGVPWGESHSWRVLYDAGPGLARLEQR